MATQYTEEFKKDTVIYWEEHKDLSIGVCAKNLGISQSSLPNWRKSYKENEGSIPTRGMGNYENDEAKENATLRKELRDKRCTRNIKKSNRYTGKLLL